MLFVLFVIGSLCGRNLFSVWETVTVVSFEMYKSLG